MDATTSTAAAHPVPIAALDGKMGVLGVTGSGKTYTAIGLIEILLSLGRQVIIIDPTGAYHGLRTEFPIFIFGGPNGDHPIVESDGPVVARAILELGMSCIIDVSLLLKESHATARRFMAGLIATLKNSPPAARYLVVDEADEFMPENASGAAAGLMGDMKWIVRRGRKDGWRVMMVTQRPQDVAKSVLTQCETLIIHKLVAPQDRKALQEWVKGNADASEAKAVLDSMARLETGEAWIWATSHGILQRTRMPANRSADSSKTPEAGDDLITHSRFQPVDRARVVELLGLPATSDESTPSAPAKIDQAETRRLKARIQELEADVPRAERIRVANVILSRALDGARRGIEGVMREIDGELAKIGKIGSPLPRSGENPAAARDEPIPTPAAPGDRPPAGIRRPAAVAREEEAAVRGAIKEAIDDGALADAPPAPKGRSLEVLAKLDGLVRQHPKLREQGAKEKTWAFLCGINSKSSTWRGHKAALRGYFVQMGDRVTISAQGETLFVENRPAETSFIDVGAGLVESFAATVKPGPSGEILRYLLRIYPESASRADLARETSVAMGSSTFRGYLAPLNALELIEKDGQNYRLARELMEW